MDLPTPARLLRAVSSRRTRCTAVVTAIVVLALVVAGCSSTGPGRSEPTTGVEPKVLIFGDSYTEGWGAASPSAGYAYLVGEPLHWEVTVDGVGSTGYVNPGKKNQGTYLTRLDRLEPQPYDLIVLQGSSNDAKMPAAEVAPAIEQTVAAVRAKYPGARLMMLGPAALYGRPTAALVEVSEVLSGYARRNQIPFIDPVADDWFRPGDAETYANPENGHPNDQGYAYIADRFIRAVRAQTEVTGR